ncbi:MULTISPECIES: YopX family protein [Helcococcus]|uniref:YopX family protein n=1 Tax=Helcococcus bovis TaxID=3153252 RepID=A0ABW9F787_9FIRM
MIPKFRAYITYGYTSQELNDPDLFEEIQETGLGFIDAPDLIDFKNERIKYDSEWYENDRFRLMQSTGLKDKNGKEIFEGDICYWKDPEPFNDEVIEDIFEVTWSDEFLRWAAVNEGGINSLYEFTDDRELKIIGNIYENKELIK